MTDRFKIGDRVMYQDIGDKPLIGTINEISKDENGEPTGYVVQLDDGNILGCSTNQLAHLDIDKL